MDNEIYLFDEPSSSLDTGYIEQLREILIRLKKLGKRIIIAEHRLYYLADIVDKIHVLKDGELNTYNEINEEIKEKYHLRTIEKIKIEPDYKKSLFDKSYDKDSDIIFKDFTYSYKRGKKVFDMNLSLKDDINFIVGRNGIGKTTFIRCLSRLNKGFNGKTYIRGALIKNPSEVFLVMQDANYQLFTESVWEEISLASDDDERKEKILKEMGLWDKKR